MPLLLGTIAIVVALGERLLPHRNARTIPPDLSSLAKTLMEHYAIADKRFRTPGAIFTLTRGVAEVVIPPRSDLVGTSVYPGMLASSGDLVILAVRRAGSDVKKETRQISFGDGWLRWVRSPGSRSFS